MTENTIIIKMINMKKIILTLAFIFILISSPTKSQITKYFSSSKINLDETAVINFLRYLEGNFHSEDVPLNRSARIMSPMFYAISEDGKVGYGWFCNSHLNSACSEDFTAYRVVEFCKEYAKMNCSIFAHGNQIVWNNINRSINNKNFNESVNFFQKLDVYDKNSSTKITEENFLYYLNLNFDNCNDNKNSSKINKFRGSSIDCLLPGRYQLTTNDMSGGNDYD